MDPATPLAEANPAASREDVLAHFREDVYGCAPVDGWELAWELAAEHVTATQMVRQQWVLSISTELGTHRCVVMIDLPRGAASAAHVSIPCLRWRRRAFPK